MMKKQDLDELMMVITKEAEPMAFTNMYVDKPCLPCGVCYIILILLAVVALGADLLSPTMGGDRGRDYGVMSSDEQKSFDIILMGDEYMKNTSTA